MEAIGLLVMLAARRGRKPMPRHSKSAQSLPLDEKGTLKWYAIKLGPGKFGIFDTFANEVLTLSAKHNYWIASPQERSGWVLKYWIGFTLVRFYETSIPPAKEIGRKS